MLKRVAQAALGLVTAAVCFAVAGALAMLAAEKAAVDISRGVASLSEEHHPKTLITERVHEGLHPSAQLIQEATQAEPLVGHSPS